VHDILGVSVFLMVFTAVVFFAPEFGGYFLEYNNFIPADPLKTPAHIAPVWYFTPFYSMLRAITDRDDVRAVRAWWLVLRFVSRPHATAVQGSPSWRRRWSPSP
jgi:quinol-cytochrome oxidoreductase complex cytochrome b subunit